MSQSKNRNRRRPAPTVEHVDDLETAVRAVRDERSKRRCWAHAWQ